MPGELLAQDLAQPPLVGGMHVRVEQADRDRLGLGLAQPGGERARIGLLERREDLPARRHPLGDLEAEPPGDERGRLRPEVVVEMRHPHPAKLEHVAEALGRHERGPRAAPLQDSVRRHGRPVGDALDRGAVGTGQLADRVDHRPVVRRRRRQDLREPKAPVGVAQQHVGERASDVGADSQPARSSSPSASDGSVGPIMSTAPRMLAWITRSASSGSRRSQAAKNSW